MIPRRIKNATARFGAPAGWDPEKDGDCHGLSVRVTDTETSRTFESAWEPTPEELAALNAGASVVLRILGSQPPVALYVESMDAGSVPA